MHIDIDIDIDMCGFQSCIFYTNIRLYGKNCTQHPKVVVLFRTLSISSVYVVREACGIIDTFAPVI